MSKKGLFIFCLWLVSAGSCKKFVEVPDPIDSIISEEVFTTDAKATSAVTAIYGSMINEGQSFSNFLVSVHLGMSADELTRFNASDSYLEFINNNLRADNIYSENIYKSLFKNIYYANAAINGLSNSATLTVTLKEQLIAECRFIRAFCYFYLTNIYGDVPLITGTDYTVNTLLPRRPVAIVDELIINDLIAAKNILREDFSGNEKVRPTKWAATALLSRMYLYKQEWQKAESNVDEIINSNLFTPLQPLSSVFLKNSKEAVWQLMPRTGVLAELQQSRPSSGVPRNIINSFLIQSFASNDQRKTRWMDSVTYQGIKYYYAGKYKNVTATVTEYYMVFRVAEQYLIRAEARAEQNKLTDAINDINVVRVRAGLSMLNSTLTKEQVIQAIYDERRKELFAEWGHRWLDLKRTGQSESTLKLKSPNFSSHDKLYPIPENDILLNPNLSQNPGY
jgi:starch-binding outer membrane protein, SusD/RagB family